VNPASECTKNVSGEHRFEKDASGGLKCQYCNLWLPKYLERTEEGRALQKAVSVGMARVALDDAREALLGALELARLFPDEGHVLATGVQRGGPPTGFEVTIAQARSAVRLEVEAASAAYVAALAAFGSATVHVEHHAPPDERAPHAVVLHDDGTWSVSGGFAHKGTFAPTEYFRADLRANHDEWLAKYEELEAEKKNRSAAFAELRTLLANCKEALKSPYPSERSWFNEQFDRALALVEKAAK
jgi:hypothetical protein